MSSPLSESIEQILDRFDEAWNGPAPPRIEDYLPPADSPDYKPTLIELVKIDLERSLKHGEKPALELYRGRFPACARDLAGIFDQAQAAAERAAGDKATDDPQILSTLEGPPAPPPLGTPAWTVGEYEVLGRLGSGGMGNVYKARHRRLDKLVALKLLPASSLSSREAAARFRREMKAVGALDHPNVVEAHDVGEQSGVAYLAMNVIDGIDLQRLVKQRGPLPIAEACKLARQAALGLRYLHERGLVHRDIKPSNLMRTQDGTVKILDLGLTRYLLETKQGESLIEMGQLMGTPDFLAPEQIENASYADTRSDLYGLGGTLFYLLTGRTPFADRKSQFSKLEAARHEPSPDLRTLRPDVPVELAVLVQRLLAKKPEQRLATAAEVAAALTPFAEEPQRLLGKPLKEGFRTRTRMENLPEAIRLVNYLVPLITAFLGALLLAVSTGLGLRTAWVAAGVLGGFVSSTVFLHEGQHTKRGLAHAIAFYAIGFILLYETVLLIGHLISAGAHR